MAGQNVLKGSLTDKFFARIKALREDNLHGEAYQEAARVLGLTGLKAQFARINREHAKLGHMRVELYEERYGAYIQLMQAAKHQLSPEQYERFYMCF